MRTSILAAALLALPCPALADGLDGEVSIELGTLHNADAAYDLFSEGNGMPSKGVRAGIAFTDHLTLIGGWHRVRRGATVYVGGDQVGFQSALLADELTIGPKVHVALVDVVYPYVATQALFFRGTMKLDDDGSTRHNPGQVEASAFAPGVLAVGGLELRSPTEAHDLAVGFFVEVGYGYVAKAEYGDFGSMRPGGIAARSGVGLRF